jgi:lipopolysaccharide transport system permease protein
VGGRSLSLADPGERPILQRMIEAPPTGRAGGGHTFATVAATRLDATVALTLSDLRARYGRGRARIVKWLLDPFFAVGVYLVLVSVVLDRPGEAPGLSIACAVVPFQLVITSVSSALTSIQVRRSILLNMRFARMLLPLATVLTETIALGSSIVLLALLMLAYGIAPTLAIVWLPALVAVTFVLSVALAYPMTIFGLWYADLRLFVISLTRTLFFIAPGLVALDQVPEGARDWLAINPLTGLFEGFRNVLIDGELPAAWHLLVPLGWAAAVLAVSLPLYRSEETQLAKMVEE